MIKLMEWLFPHRVAELENENNAAAQDVHTSRVLRARAERMAGDGFTDGYAQAFYANDRRRRKA